MQQQQQQHQASSQLARLALPQLQPTVAAGAAAAAADGSQLALPQLQPTDRSWRCRSCS
jgi:hypothetical protein